jgi:polyprenyl P-hydroxybenzoate/phenylacrylic acid decarboxylase-like protein
MAKRIIVGMTGATGQVYGIEALKLLQTTDYDSHLVLSDSSRINLKQEADLTPKDVEDLADVVYDIENIGASIASGSFRTDGMLVAPCSMKTLSNIAHANSGDLISRAADVVLKERRSLVVMPREKPLNSIHLENMLAVTKAGGIIMPPFPSFYEEMNSVTRMIRRTVSRALMQFDIDVAIDEWQGIAGTIEE